MFSPKQIFLWLWLCAALVWATPCRAAVADFGKLVPYKEYSVEAFSDGFRGYCEIAHSGTLAIEYSGEKPGVYSDEQMTKSLSVTIDAGGSLGKVMKIDVEQGDVVYVGHGFMPQSMKMRVLPPLGELTLTEVSPEENSIISIFEATARFVFSDNVKIDAASLIVGDVERMITFEVGQNIVSVDFAAELKAERKMSRLVGGDSFAVRLTNVRYAEYEDLLFGEDGVVDVRYVLADREARLVQVIAPEAFIPYWDTTADAGVVKLQFDDEISPDGCMARLQYGSPEDNECYTETLPISVRDKDVEIDLRGKSRTAEEMLPRVDNPLGKYPSISLIVSGINDIFGLPVAGNTDRAGEVVLNLEISQAGVEIIFANPQEIDYYNLNGVKVQESYPGVKISRRGKEISGFAK